MYGVALFLLDWCRCKYNQGNQVFAYYYTFITTPDPVLQRHLPENLIIPHRKMQQCTTPLVHTINLNFINK